MSQNEFDQTVLWDPVVSGSDYLRMLTRFHHHALISLEKFSTVREPGEAPQLYGQAMPASKRDGIAAIDVPSCQGCHVVVSDGYEKTVGVGDWIAGRPDVHRNSDLIAWDDVRHAESAFSSPQSFQSILQIGRVGEPRHG
jgi:hypothetical protein